MCEYNNQSITYGYKAVCQMPGYIRKFCNENRDIVVLGKFDNGVMLYDLRGCKGNYVNINFIELKQLLYGLYLISEREKE